MRKDSRLFKLAENILRNSVKLQPGDKIYIESSGTLTVDWLAVMVETATQMGAIPFYYYNDTCLHNAMLQYASRSQIVGHAAFHAKIMEEMDAYIGIRCVDNPFDASVPGMDQSRLYQNEYVGPVHFDIRVPNTRWCLLRYPTPVMAYQSSMPTSAFEDFYFEACLIDYPKMEKAMLPLKALLERTDKVHIVAPGTDLEFSVKGIGVCTSHGLRNIPDGEVFTAPVADTANGYIRFNTRSAQAGKMFSSIELKLEKGRIIEACSNPDDADLQKILDTDAGSRSLGEFAFGLNPCIKKAIGDSLFDEKIAGSIHLAIGASAPNTFNGNKSSVHWDLVQIQTPEAGGGEIWFDGVLIRKDGRFILEELSGLNSENLL